MIADNLVRAAEVAIVLAEHRPTHIPAALDSLAEHVDELLDMEGEPAAPLREAGRRVVIQLMAARAAYPSALHVVSACLRDVLRQAILAQRLAEDLPAIPAPGIPPWWRAQHHGRPPFTVIRGGLT